MSAPTATVGMPSLCRLPGWRLLAWALLLACSPGASGQQPRPVFLAPLAAAEAPVLTLAQLEQMALTGNPTIPAAAALVTQQQGLLRQATLYPNPTSGYLRTDPDQAGQSQTAGVFLSQEFVTPGKIRLARLAGQADVQHSDWQLEAQKVRVVNDVRIRYYEVLGAQEAVAAAAEVEGLAVEGVKVAQQLQAAKQGSRPDVLQAEIQLSAVRTSLQDARYRYESARRHLAHVAGMPELPPLPLAGRLEDDLPSVEWQQALAQLLASSPLLRAQQALIQSIQYELKLARLQAVPNVNVQLVAQRDSVMKFSSVSTLVSLPVPVFNRNQGNVLNLEGQLAAAQQEYERIRLAAQDQLASSYRQYQSLRSQVERLHQEILPRSKENLDLTTQAYRLGQFDFPRVLAARQTYFQTHTAYIDALTELHKTAIEINGLLLTGGLNPTEVGTALQAQPGMGTTGIRSILLQQMQEQRGGASRNLPGAVQAGER